MSWTLTSLTIDRRYVAAPIEIARTCTSRERSTGTLPLDHAHVLLTPAFPLMQTSIATPPSTNQSGSRSLHLVEIKPTSRIDFSLDNSHVRLLPRAESSTPRKPIRGIDLQEHTNNITDLSTAQMMSNQQINLAVINPVI